MQPAKYLKIVTAIVAFAPVLGAQTKPPREPIARIGDQAIYDDDLLPSIGGQLWQLRSQEYELKIKALENLLNQRLLENEAKSQGLSTDALLEQKLRREERVALASCELTLKVKPDGSSDGWFKSLPALQTAMFKKAIDAYATPRRDHLHSEITAESAQIEPLDRRLETSREELPYPNRMGRAFCELIEHLPRALRTDWRTGSK